jgi:hypothetical protein
MWLCWHLACELTGDATLTAEFLPQHKQREGSIGGFAVVGEWLHMTADAVESRVTAARKRRDTPEYHDWLNHREKQWWFYHTVCVEKREPKLRKYVGEVEGDTRILTRGDLYFTPKEVEAIVAEAKVRLKDEGARGKRDYAEWLALYERRDEIGRSRPLEYLPSTPAESIAMDAARAANGLRNGKTNRGRPQSTN